MKAMGNTGNNRHLDFDPNCAPDYKIEGGIGTATTLPMTDEEKQKVQFNPMGFIWPKVEAVERNQNVSIEVERQG